MRFKRIPEPPDSLDALADYRRAVPLVPGSENDCCARLQRRTDVATRDAARTWLAFLRALELVEETDSGYARTRADADPAALADAFRERVLGAQEALAALDEGPTSADAVFEAVRPAVPQWERHRNPGTWEAEWRERVERLLGWAVLLGLVDRSERGYERTGRR